MVLVLVLALGFLLQLLLQNFVTRFSWNNKEPAKGDPGRHVAMDPSGCVWTAFYMYAMQEIVKKSRKRKRIFGRAAICNASACVSKK